MERFLVVDDDPNITLALTKVITALGFEVSAHTDSREAAKESVFDVVVTDFMMPHLNGIELLAVLREKQPDSVRLMLTAASDFKVAMDAVNRGHVYRLLGKPWQLAELRAVLTQAVEFLRLSRDNKRLTGELAARNAELVVFNRTLEGQVTERTSGLLEGMVRALDYRDTETQWHSWRVAKYTRRIAEVANVPPNELEQIEQGALLHDIGKIGVRDSILLKPGPLTPEEWVEMRTHPEIGWRMLANIPYLHHAAMVVHQHQERWDGKGYPQGLAHEAITLGARIFCIADTLDAITSDRPYRKGAPLDSAITEIGRLGGTQFDPKLVEVFLGIDREAWVDIRKTVEGMEHADKLRFAGRPPIPSRRP